MALLAMSKDGNFTGKVITESEEFFRVELFDAFALVGCGLFVESGELRDLDKSDTRLFNDYEALGMALTNALRHLEVKERS